MNRIRITTGRGADGKFVKGNSCAKSHGAWQSMNRLRKAVVCAVSEEDIQEIVAKLVSLAKGGDYRATRLLFDYTIGRAESLDLLGRLDELEELVGERARV